jgi:hypothetical protein
MEDLALFQCFPEGTRDPGTVPAASAMWDPAATPRRRLVLRGEHLKCHR